MSPIIEHVVLGFFLGIFSGGHHHEAPSSQQVTVTQELHSDGFADTQVQCLRDSHARRYSPLNRALLQSPARLPVCGTDEEREAENGVQP